MLPTDHYRCRVVEGVASPQPRSTRGGRNDKHPGGRNPPHFPRTVTPRGVRRQLGNAVA